ncbi:putative histone-lysine N-methyltransferase transcription factor C2H2 family [Lupinus albus]|uniref:Putative histone-lysine N-methyltransferase transcription factor C2H2 family n=1 Tax=Lupinus albus TaxID=3870 RepID=A0A6A4QJK1_LUPAL|nr:putative histone-lysine N-methyltransferase transcription factor C2H2 family [Lupinus albus]
MEVLPCSGVQRAGESDCPQESSETAFAYQRGPNCPENVELVKLDDRPNDPLCNMEGLQIEGQGQGQQTAFELLTNSDCQCREASCFDCQVEDQNESGSFDDEINEHCLTSHNPCSIMDTFEGESPKDSGEGELSFSEPTWLKGDESLALWVKWRGMWQVGIRCARADWPLSTLKAKPTHDRKKYFVIFFPKTRNYSWADMMLVRSINEFPQPIAYKNHKAGLKMVKDLTVARRFIMQKLAVGMLNIVDQLHSNALIETARDVMVWKEFAMEASRCDGYSDFGRMLLKLQNSIMQHYINADWIQHSSQSWFERCQNAHSAESVELLKEELFDSILWNVVNTLGDAVVQPTISSVWKTWKHDVMKLFSAFPSISSYKERQQQTPDGLYQVSLQAGRKRPKLEVRRAETHASPVEMKGLGHSITLETDPGFFKNQDRLSSLVAETSKQAYFGEVPIESDSPNSLTNKWNTIIAEAVDSNILHTDGMELTPVNEMAGKKVVESGTKNQQCIAYIEAKGRQCVRLSIDDDVYCCVHSRYLGSLAKTEKPVSVDTPICDGTTVLGTRCKHHALPGFSFCKKHRPHAETGKASNLIHNTLKRKHEENYYGSEGLFCKDLVLVNVESPLQVVPVSVIGGDSFHGQSNLHDKPIHRGNGHNAMEALHCIGSPSYNDKDRCLEAPNWYSLYCEMHLPSWLKRAKNAKSRIISKEVFTELLRDCHSWEQKIHLHKACEIFYRLFKSILPQRKPAPKEEIFQWALTEASKDSSVEEMFTKLVHSEKESLKLIWGFNDEIDASPSVEGLLLLPSTINDNFDDENAIKCKICSAQFPDNQTLGNHWMDNHKKEAQWLFRGYACAICLDSFTNKKLLETHVQERHRVQFVEQCLLLQCIPCGSHFGNMEELWLHVLSVHPVEFKRSKAPDKQILSTIEEESPKQPEQGNSVSLENNYEYPGGTRKFVCRFCGLKFDLLPDLGRHHQAAHMGRNLVSNRPAKKKVHYYSHRLKSGRLGRPRFKNGLAAASYRISKANANLETSIETIKSLDKGEKTIHSQGAETENILEEYQCSAVAKVLFSEIHKTKPRPNNLDILSIARSACCKVSLKASLEEKYGILPEGLYLKAAKLCGEHNILVNWHQDGFICSRGCKVLKDQTFPLASLSNGYPRRKSVSLSEPMTEELEVDEFHYIINSNQLKFGSSQKGVVLCDDLSFRKESIPIICVVDEEILNSQMQGANEKDSNLFRPWESFTYITKPMLDPSLNLTSESLQLGCACSVSTCSPERCDHVYLFDSDYDDSKDIFGKPMRGRFPYDENGRIILEEGYLVYECNHMCRCDKTCPNRILQNGVRVKLEVFKTEKKGWAVRAGEAIMRGTFVCEYIGEVLDEQEAHNRRKRYGKENCSYLYDINGHVNDMSRLIEGQAKYVIDSTIYGNVSRFINNSCSPNLVSHQVLVESMDCELAHIGLYASRDIALGEELTFNYHYELVPGEGTPCLCGSLNCRGRLY